MRVSIIGAGYVGLVTGACLAEKGHTVVCVDVDTAKVDAVNRSTSPIFEHGLDELLCRNVPARLTATTDLRHAVTETELTMIAVGTPFDGREIDLRFMKEAARQIGEALRQKAAYHVVVVKSTVVPGTTDNVVRPILEEASGKKAGHNFGMAMNPEFLTEGEAVNDFLYPDRIILGGMDTRSVEALEQLYAGFEGVPRVRTNNKTAEMIKYAANTLLATLISFSNEIGNLCAALGGVDVVDVMQGVHLSRYFTSPLPGDGQVTAPITAFLAAGCGFGGSCLPKDTSALIAHGQRAGVAMPLLEAVMRINQAQPQQVLARLRKHFPSLAGKQVTVLGLAFRPDTSDMRESPAIPIVRALVEQGAHIRAYDPAAAVEASKVFPNGTLKLCESLEQAVAGADAVVLVTRWEEFRHLPEVLARLDRRPVVVDGRRLLDKTQIASYEGIGL